MIILPPETHIDEGFFDKVSPSRVHLRQVDEGGNWDWFKDVKEQISYIIDNFPKCDTVIIHPPLQKGDPITYMSMIQDFAGIAGIAVRYENLTKRFFGGNPEDIINAGFKLCYDVGHHYLVLIRSYLGKVAFTSELLDVTWQMILDFAQVYSDEIDYVHLESPVWLRDAHVHFGYEKALITESMIKAFLDVINPKAVLVSSMFDKPWYKDDAKLVLEVDI